MLGLLVIEVKGNILLYRIRVFFEFAMDIPYLCLQLITSLNNFSRDRIWYGFEFMLGTLPYLIFKISDLQDYQRKLHNILITLHDIILGSIWS